MITLGLTGSRYSGKSRVADIFNQIQVPVFEADTIIKFILNYNYELLGEIKASMGDKIFNNSSDNELSLDLRKLKKDNLDKILDFVEADLFEAYRKFNIKAKNNNGAIYTIFHSSILFEKGWEKKLDLVVNVFAPDTDRMKRCKHMTNLGLLKVKELTDTEMDPLSKNKLADFIIQNHNDSTLYAIPGKIPSSDILKQVNKIDQRVIDEYLYKENVNYLI